MDRSTLERKALTELKQIASALELRGYQRMKKADLVSLIIDAGQGSGDGDRTGANGAPAPSGDGDRDEDRTRTRARATQASDGGASAGGEPRDADRPTERASDRDEARGGEARRGDQARRGDEARREDESRRDEVRRGDESRGDDARGEESRDDDGDGSDRDDDAGSRARNKRDRRRKNRGNQPGGHGGPDDLDGAEVREGVLDLLPEGYGFLRVTGYLSGERDVYVSQSFVRRFDLRRGDRVAGPIRRNKNNDKFPALGRVDRIEGVELADLGDQRRPDFKDLTPLFPDQRLQVGAHDDAPVSLRLVDMLAPIGKGQRGLIVSPPKAGKTTILKQLAAAIEAADPDVHLMVVLVDERPEEVTDFRRSTQGEVISSTFDRPAEDHTQVAELAIERAKRLAERGRDVVVLLDSITRLGRAYNVAAPTSGRVMSGGVDAAALYPPKRFFGAARNLEEGGSLTIVATALIETGSRADEVIFEEFKGTGNMELRLDRRLEQKRVFPAIDIQASGTRREDLLLDDAQIDTVWKLRRLLASMEPEAALHLLIDKVKATRSNDQFLQMIAKSNLQ